MFGFSRIVRKLDRVIDNQIHILKRQGHIMSALSDLQDKVGSLEATSANAVVAINDLKNQVATGASPEALNAVTAKVAAVVDSLNAAIAPTP